MMTDKQPSSLYIHVPFCTHICGYCDFAKTAYIRKTAERWLQAIEIELQAKQINPFLKTIYIGGGTPTALDDDLFERLLKLLSPYAYHVLEYTIEINPETLTRSKAEIMRRYGINRASVGYQTDDPQYLKLMNRCHDADQVETCIQILRENGISNISLDIMYSLPNQTLEQVQRSVHRALSMNPDHLSLYSLQIEENTVFGKKGIQHASDEDEADMYEWIVSYLPKYGFVQYEISNFALPGKESMHNKVYWHYEDFYGIGCGASGKELHTRYDKPSNLREYFDDPLAMDTIKLSVEDEMFEYLMMGLRLKQGVSLSMFEDRFQHSIFEYYRNEIDVNVQKKLLEVCNGYLRCTDIGYEMLNSILIDFLPAEKD